MSAACYFCKRPIGNKETRYNTLVLSSSFRYRKRTWCKDCNQTKDQEVLKMLEQVEKTNEKRKSAIRI